METQRVVVAVFAVLLAGLCVLPGLNAAPIQCNNGNGTQVSENGYQSQTQYGPGCQTQSSENGSQSQSQSGSGTQSQTQCSGSDCGEFSPFPPLFTMKPFEPFPSMEPFQPMTPFPPMTPMEWKSRSFRSLRKF